MEMALVNLHNHPWSAEHQIAILPCSMECLRDNAVEDVTVFEPCSLRDSGRCKDGFHCVTIAPSLERGKELADVTDIPQGRVGQDVHAETTVVTPQGEVEVSSRLVCRQGSLALGAQRLGFDQANTNEEMPNLLVRAEGVGSND